MSNVINESYLGDGAYIAQDGFGGIILAANDKVSGAPTDMVYLDVDGVNSLLRYLEGLGNG